MVDMDEISTVLEREVLETAVMKGVVMARSSTKRHNAALKLVRLGYLAEAPRASNGQTTWLFQVTHAGRTYWEGWQHDTPDA